MQLNGFKLSFSPPERVLKKLVSHLSFPLFAPQPPPSYRDNPTPNAPVTHPRRPPEADEARFRFSSPLYFCAVFRKIQKSKV